MLLFLQHIYYYEVSGCLVPTTELPISKYMVYICAFAVHAYFAITIGVALTIQNQSKAFELDTGSIYHKQSALKCLIQYFDRFIEGSHYHVIATYIRTNRLAKLAYTKYTKPQYSNKAIYNCMQGISGGCFTVTE